MLETEGSERWPSGLRQRFAKPSYGYKPVPRVRIPPSPFKDQQQQSKSRAETEKELLHQYKSISIFLALITANELLTVFCEIGRARWGASGTLYSQSAIARLNSFPRVDRIEPLLP
jgi:hypothetical protein